MIERMKKWTVLLLAAAVLLAGAPAYASGDGYSTYENRNVMFTLDYPSEYDVSEPYVNCVYITDGDDFRFSVEYAFQTMTANSAVYSAADFAAQIDDESQVLSDWVGTDLTLTGRHEGELAGMQCIVYDYETTDGHVGSMALFDSQGDFGCYCVSAYIDKASSKLDTYMEQASYMIDSFSITGPCQPEGYTHYAFDGEDGPVDFILQDDFVSAVNPQENGSIIIYPVDHVFIQANITVHQTPYDEDYETGEVIENVCNYYFKYKDDTAYYTDVEQMRLGRYDMTARGVTYSSNGDDLTTDEFIFLHDGYYWEIYCSYTAEHEDAVYTTVVDLLCSLRVGGETQPAPSSGSSVASGITVGGKPVIIGGSGLSGEDDAPVVTARTWSVNEQIDQIAAETKAVAGYYESSYMPPLASATDVDNDGVWEFLEVYETKNASTGATTVRYAAWALQEGGPVLLASDALYLEVGGNGGSIGLTMRDGTCYFIVMTDSPDGDSFHRTWRYIPWEGASLGSGETTLTADGTYFQSGGEYTVDGAAVSQSDFNAEQDAFGEMFHMDIVEGHGNGNVMTLDVADSWDFDL